MMFPKATKGDRFTKVWSKEFYNYLLDQIRQDLNVVGKPKSFTYDPVKALRETSGSYVGFTPVALVTSSQIRGGFKSPVIKVGDLNSSLPFGVLQSHCTERQASDLIVEGVSWCHVTVTNTAHKYAAISGTTLVSQSSANNAVARIIAAVEDGPSLIQFPLPQGGDTALSITCYATVDFDNTDATIPIKVLKIRNGTGVEVDDEFSIPNKLWKFGTTEYTYGGLQGTIIEAQQDEDEVWTILEMTCTTPCDPVEEPPEV
jgi:hypothetical protein